MEYIIIVVSVVILGILAYKELEHYRDLSNRLENIRTYSPYNYELVRFIVEAKYNVLYNLYAILLVVCLLLSLLVHNILV